MPIERLLSAARLPDPPTMTSAERRAVRVLLLAVAIIVDLMRGRRQDWLA